MFYRPTIGGRLTEGDFRSREVTGWIVLAGQRSRKELQMNH